MLEIFYHQLYTDGIDKTSRFPRERYKLIFNAVKNLKNAEIKFTTPNKINIQNIYSAHDSRYVDSFLNNTLSISERRKIGLRPWTDKIIDRTLYIMGGSLGAVHSAIKNNISANLAGGTHHAHYAYGSGYCIFNDLSISAIYCKKNLKNYDNILIIDLDVHQGDGTAAIHKSDNSVFTFSMHCETNFPLKKTKSDLDVFIKKNTEDNEYLNILKQNLKIINKVKADIIFFQAGVDTLHTDSLGHLNLTREGLKKRNDIVLQFCKEKKCPVVVFMGGGYSLPITHTVDSFTDLFEQCSQYSIIE